MSEFMVHILEADNPFYEGMCESIIIPTIQGQFGILAHHSNMISVIVPGIMRYKVPGQGWLVASVSDGMVKVEDGEVLILVDSAEHPDEIDFNRARREADQAKEEMLQHRSIQEYRLAQASLARAASRLKLKQDHLRG